MSKWEYCQILWMSRVAPLEQIEELERGFEGVIDTLDDSTFVASLGFLKYLSRPEKEPIKSLSNTIAQLGLDGWEMISHNETHNPTTVEVFYFKRQVQDE